MERLCPDLFNWGMRLHHEGEFVKDCIQEIFLCFWKIQDTIAPVENVRSYLLVVLKSRILRELSKKENKLYQSLTDDYAVAVEFSADLHLIEEEHEVYQLRKLEQVTLKDTGIEENTIFVFSADHGDLLGSHGWWNKQQPYDESIRVPFLLHYSAMLGKKGSVSEALLNTPDIMPALLGLSDLATPKSVEGTNYANIFEGK